MASMSTQSDDQQESGSMIPAMSTNEGAESPPDEVIVPRKTSTVITSKQMMNHPVCWFLARLMVHAIILFCYINHMLFELIQTELIISDFMHCLL